ncbi:hypothetical protein [Phascolarctobacterium succinatutens]|uniref:hypothetical protein n=1 Tax=Phascolarctobacterium succinatutens TaxID=626940 RepID=UPI0023F372BD|nr:hypothetical protein [Phascolarctobacterium succinatutens]
MPNNFRAKLMHVAVAGGGCHFYFDAHTGKMVVDPATFHYVAQKPTGFLDFFTSINKGFKGGITIIAFLFMVGGSLNILLKTGAIVAGLSALVKKIRNHSILLIPVLMTTLISRQYNEFIKEVRC